MRTADAAPSPPAAPAEAGARGVMVIFFLSGFAALLYQVVWQRALFTIYGTNIEAVTVVVTAFLLGLGAGSALGGRLSLAPRSSALRLFALFELGIGAFGAVSLQLFEAVGEVTLQLSPVATAAVTLLLVLPPTVLMGATLPLLVAHGVRQRHSVGEAVARMYFVNTLGSAAGSLACGSFLLWALGLRGTTWVAVALNVLVGLVGLVLARGGRPEVQA